MIPLVNEDYKSKDMVLSVDLTIYMLRERVSLSLAPVLFGDWKQSRHSLLFFSEQNNWMKAAGSETASKPFCISECLPLFDTYINSREPLPDSRSISLQ